MSIRVTASTDADALARRMTNLVASQVPFATATALNSVARAVEVAERDGMRRAFDRPTSFILNSLLVIPAKKTNLVAEVRTKDIVSRHGHILERQSQGGFRINLRRTEDRIQQITNHLMLGYVPADNAQLDAYGNWSTAERNRVLSALQAQGDRFANTTSRSRGRNRRRADYFIPKPGGGLTPGVYKRQGKQIGIILHFLRQAPRYEPRFDFQGIARRTFAELWNPLFEAAMQQALATAGGSGAAPFYRLRGA